MKKPSIKLMAVGAVMAGALAIPLAPTANAGNDWNYKNYYSSYHHDYNKYYGHYYNYHDNDCDRDRHTRYVSYHYSYDYCNCWW